VEEFEVRSNMFERFPVFAWSGVCQPPETNFATPYYGDFKSSLQRKTSDLSLDLGTVKVLEVNSSTRSREVDEGGDRVDEVDDSNCFSHIGDIVAHLSAGDLGGNKIF